MNTKQLNALQAKSVKALQSIVSRGNVEFQGTGTKLWRENLDETFAFLAYVKVSANGFFYLEPDMEGVTDENGNQARPFRLFAGTTYGELETFGENEKILVTVIQRTPTPRDLITQAELDRINKWAEDLAREEGRELTVRATAAWEKAIAQDLVSYVVKEISEL